MPEIVGEAEDTKIKNKAYEVKVDTNCNPGAKLIERDH